MNRITIKWAHSYPKFFTFSFDLGVFISVVMLPMILLWSIMPIIVDSLSKDEQVPSQKLSSEKINSNSGGGGLQFELMLPGVNLPLDEIIYYAVA